MNLLKTIGAISSLTLLSRITGLLRETMFARAFGASAETDAFNVAFRLPNLLRRLFAEGAFSQAFVPILSEYKNSGQTEATHSLVDHVATALVWATLAISVAGILASPWLIWLIADGLDARAFNDAVLMTQLMFPYIACMSFVALAAGVLNTWREFKIPAFTPVLLNLSFIVAALALAPMLERPIYAMPIAVMVGGVLQVALQIPALVKIGMLPRLAFNPLTALRDPGVQRMLKKMGSAVFGVSAAQISLLINTKIAASLAVGSVSALTYADRLMEFPTALLGVALGTVLLPSLSKASSEGDHTEYSSLLNWGLRLTLLLALPSAVGLAVLAEGMVATLFHYGEFSTANLMATTYPLMAYAAGLLGIILVKTLAPAFYARQDVKTPVYIAVAALICTQMMNILFVPLFGVAGLALSIGLGACVNAGLLYFLMRKRAIFVPQAGWWPFFLKLVVAVAAMGALAWALGGMFDWAALRAQPLLRIGALFGIIGLCAGAYFALLFAMGFRLADFKRTGR
jgi:putative peptidoglycan lipid II flippase